MYIYINFFNFQIVSSTYRIQISMLLYLWNKCNEFWAPYIPLPYCMKMSFVFGEAKYTLQLGFQLIMTFLSRVGTHG